MAGPSSLQADNRYGVKHKAVFVVQGEGRGHMTQALSLKAQFEKIGWEVAAVLVGTSPQRLLPKFFTESWEGIPIHSFQSPNFLKDAEGKGIRIAKTIWHSALRLNLYRKSLGLLRSWLANYEPSVVINFYEPLLGLHYLLKNPSVPMVCVGHQMLCFHQEFQWPRGRSKERLALKLLNWLSANRASLILALSFYPLESDPQSSLKVAPPLLRQSVLEKRAEKGDYLLVYLLNSGYADELIAWQEQHTEWKVHCFWDNQEKGETHEVSKGMIFHQLDGELFIEMLSKSRAVVSTAGFETVSEALYFQKPFMTVPVKGHYEQFLNSIDALKTNYGVTANSFDLNPLVRFLEKQTLGTRQSSEWLSQSTLQTRHAEIISQLLSNRGV